MVFKTIYSCMWERGCVCMFVSFLLFEYCIIITVATLGA
jgi:hypothetical protein